VAESVGSGVREKLRRANLHRETLDERVKGFGDSDAYTVSRHDDIEAGKRDWIVHIHKPLPRLCWGPIIGDCLFNFRSALDHLAYDLALAHTGRQRPLTDREERGSEFPIFWERAGRTDEFDRKIGAIHPEARKLIEDMQPYGRKGRAALKYVQALNNLDKHRMLHLVSTATIGVGYAGDMEFDFINFGALKDGDVLASAPMKPETDQHPKFMFGVAFSELGEGLKPPDVLMTLSWIDQHIKKGVIPALLPYL
jgi:hypothetical protein